MLGFIGLARDHDTGTGSESQHGAKPVDKAGASVQPNTPGTRLRYEAYHAVQEDQELR